MRSLVVAAVLAAAGGWSAAAVGDEPGDAVAWLQRILAATERLSYTGTFVYQHGGETETSRITRIVDATGVHERLEILDGTPREVVRFNEEVQCYLPRTRTLKIDRQTGAAQFPGIRAEPRALAAYYQIRLDGHDRIAGFDCQAILLKPKDRMRYGHKLWADVRSGMLIKAKTFNERDEPVEVISFTQLQIGGDIDKDRVKSRFADGGAEWRVERSGVEAVDLARLGWLLTALPPGYKKVTELKRRLGSEPDVGHIVVSDGLAAVSVFIEPLARRAAGVPLGPSRQGAVNVYTRQLDDHLVTVVGEAPAQSVKLIAQNVEYRRPQ